MNRPESSSPANNEQYQRREIDALVTNYDRVTEGEGSIIGWERATDEYEKKGWRGALKKVKFSLFRQSINRKYVHEAQQEIKKNSVSLLLDSREANAAVAGLGLKDKPYIERDEFRAYRELVSKDTEHADRMDESKYAVHKAHLEDKLQNLITSLAKYSDRNDRSNYQTQINAWVDSAIATLPEYFQSEDRPLIVQQITESVDQAIQDYDAEVAKHKTPQEVAKVNLAIAGKHRYEGKTKPLYRLREALKHPAIWSGVAIAAKALHLAPGVGGVLAGIRKHNWVADDLKRMEVERLHGHTGKMDAYRQELSETFGGMYPAEEIIDSIQFNLREVKAVSDPLKMRPGAISSLVEGLGTVQAINQHGYKAISYSPGQMQRQKLKILQLQAEAQLTIERLNLKQEVLKARRKAAVELEQEKDKQDKSQRSLKRRKALKTGAMVAATSLATMGIAAAMPDEWAEEVTEKVESGARYAWDKINPVESVSAQDFEHGMAYAPEALPETDEPVANINAESLGDGSEASIYNQEQFEPSPAATESPSLWQELVSEQDQRDRSNDEFITYGTSEIGEYNELEIKYQPTENGIVIDVSGMEPNADGVGGDEFDPNRPLEAVFYLTEHDLETGNEIRVPIPEDGRLIINQDTHPELMPLFENNNGAVEQQFARLGIASQNADGSYTFYASNPGEDISQEVINQMQAAKVNTEPYMVSEPNESNPNPGSGPITSTTESLEGNATPDASQNEQAISLEGDATPDPYPNMTGGDITLENGEVPQDTEEVMSLEGNASPDPYPNMTGGDVTLENGGAPAHVDSREMQELGFPWGLTSDAPHQMSNLKRNGQPHTPESGTTPPSRTPEAPQPGGPNLPEGQNSFLVLTEANARIAIEALERATNKSASAEKFLSEHGDALKFAQRLGDQVYLLTPEQNGMILALTFNVNNANDVNTRVWRMSGSDHQWKSVPGLRENGQQFIKGEEDNPDHHYVQSAKLNPDIYLMLEEVGKNKLDGVQINNIEDYLPIRRGRFNSELEVKESHTRLQNQEWQTYQDKMRYAYEAYQSFIMDSANKQLNLSSEGDNFKLISQRLESARNHNNPDSSYFKFEPFINTVLSIEQEIDRLENGDDELKQRAEVLKNALYSVDLSTAEHPIPHIARLKQAYLQSVGEFIEKVASIEPPTSMIPDFSEDNIKRIYFKSNPPGQDRTGILIEEYEVTSADGDVIRWAMATDSDGRVYIDNVYNPNDTTTDYGTQQNIVNMGFLVYKPEDYRNQTFGIPDKYRDDDGSGKYVSISKLWSENVPLIKAYSAELTRRGGTIRPGSNNETAQSNGDNDPNEPPVVLFNPDDEQAATDESSQATTNETNQTNAQTPESTTSGEQVQLERERLAAEVREREHQAQLAAQQQIIEQVLQDRKNEREVHQQMVNATIKLAETLGQKSSEPEAVKQDAEALRLNADAAKSTLEAIENLNRSVESLANQNEVPNQLVQLMQAMHTSLSESLSRTYQLNESLVSQIQSQVQPSGNNSEVLAAISELQNGMQAGFESIRSERAVSISDRIQRIKQRRRVRSNPRRINRNPVQSTRPTSESPGESSETPGTKQGNFESQQVYEQARINAAERAKNDFLDYHSSGEHRSNSVSAIRKKAYDKLRELYPQQYDQLRPLVKNKIDQELLNPWKNNENTPDQRRSWLEQLYNDQFYANIAGVEPTDSKSSTSRQQSAPNQSESATTPEESANASTSNESTSQTKQSAQPTTSETSAPSEQTQNTQRQQGQTRPAPRNERQQLPVRAEDMEDYEEGKRAQGFEDREEYRESRQYRMRRENARQRQEEDQRRKQERLERQEQQRQSTASANPESEAPQANNDTRTETTPENPESNQSEPFTPELVKVKEVTPAVTELHQGYSQFSELDQSQKTDIARLLERSIESFAQDRPDGKAMREQVGQEYSNRIQHFINDWSSLTPQQREQGMNRYYNGTILNRIIRGYLNRADNESSKDTQPGQEAAPDNVTESVAESPEQAPVEAESPEATQVDTVAPESVKIADDEEDQLERNANRSGKTSKRNNRILREAKESMGTPYVEDQETETQTLSKEAMELLEAVVAGMDAEQKKDFIETAYANLPEDERKKLLDHVLSL